jgi:ribonuclease HII
MPPPRPQRFDPPGTSFDRALVCGEIEAHLRAEGLWPLLGTDEVGRGPLAGPVVVAAVVLRDGAVLPGLNDSKLLTEKQREALAPLIREQAVAWAVVEGSLELIDELNILHASLQSMRKACDQVWRQIKDLGETLPRVLVVDGHMAVPGFARIPQRMVVKGDSRSLAIAAASVLAKVHRDTHMVAMDVQHPGYGFADHKGYGTPQHLEALKRLGPCAIHRRSFQPVAEAYGARQPRLPL